MKIDLSHAKRVLPLGVLREYDIEKPLERARLKIDPLVIHPTKRATKFVGVILRKSSPCSISIRQLRKNHMRVDKNG